MVANATAQKEKIIAEKILHMSGLNSNANCFVMQIERIKFFRRDVING